MPFTTQAYTEPIAEMPAQWLTLPAAPVAKAVEMLDLYAYMAFRYLSSMEKAQVRITITHPSLPKNSLSFHPRLTLKMNRYFETVPLTNLASSSSVRAASIPHQDDVINVSYNNWSVNKDRGTGQVSKSH